MKIEITIEASSADKSKHLRRNFYNLLQRLGFKIHLSSFITHNSIKEYVTCPDKDMWSHLIAIRETDNGSLDPSQKEPDFELATDLLMLPFTQIKKQYFDPK